MNAAIASILKSYLVELPFVDKIAGMVQPLTITDQDASGRSVRRIFPVSCDVCYEDCKKPKGPLRDMVPDSSKRSILYFEDFGVRNTGQTGDNTNFESTLRLICWINKKKIGRNDCSVSADAIASIMAELPIDQFVNCGTITRIRTDVIGQELKSAAIFSRYTYDEAITQYLMDPFDYFAINLRTVFSINSSCVGEFKTSGSQLC